MQVASRNSNTINMTSEAHLLREIENSLRKIHKTKQHMNFIQTCLFQEVLPKFILLSQYTIERLKFNKKQIKNYRTNILIDALNNHNSNLIFFSQKYQNLSLKFQTLNPDFKKNLAILHSKTIASEQINDDQRNDKLKKLIQPNNNNIDPNVEVFNYSTQIVPENILSILKRGILNGVGGYNKKNCNFG